MKIRLVSDVHTELMAKDLHKIDSIILKTVLPDLPTDKDTTLILAGDIGSQHKPLCLKAFLDHVSARFQDVIYIPGNHESYGGDISNRSIEEMVTNYKNVTFGSQILSQEPNAPKIVGCTLWTDCHKTNPLTVSTLQHYMNDYRHISKGDSILSPADTIEIHKANLAFLEEHVEEGCIVVTHHSPSFLSTHPKYAGQRMNGGYCSDLNEFILRKKPRLWIHGHLHDPVDYVIGGTRILSNPRGYVGENGLEGFREDLVLEV